MKVRAIFETDGSRVVLIAEGDAERRLLGVLGTNVHAEVSVTFDGHFTHQKASSVSIELTSLPDPKE
jgi:hypothetical protein